MFWRKLTSAPGEYDREQARLCRVAAALAKTEGDYAHADQMETSAAEYDKAALGVGRTNPSRHLAILKSEPQDDLCLS